MNAQDIRQGWTSASSAEADSLCPGRFNSQKGIPEPSKDDSANFGTRVHAALAAGTPEGLNAKEKEAFDSLRAIESNRIAAYFGIELTSPPLGIREKRLWVGSATLKHSGQPDAIHRKGTKALVADFKSIRWVDHPASPGNLQLRDYVCLVWHNSVMLEEIACVVIDGSTQEPEICRYTKADIERATAEMFERVKASNDPNSPRIPGEAQCKYCRAKTSCVEYARWSVADVPMRLTLPDGVSINSWTGEQLAAALGINDKVEDFFAQVKMESKARLEKEPASVPGYTLRPNKPLEKCNNPQMLFNRFSDIGGTLTDFMACVSILKGELDEQVSKIVTARKNGGDPIVNVKKAAKAQVAELLEGIVDVTPKAPSLVKAKEIIV